LLPSTFDLLFGIASLRILSFNIKSFAHIIKRKV